jgi:hypothetical protein
MKIIFKITFFSCLFGSVYGQSSFYGGAHGSYQSSAIITQQNYGQRDQAVDYKFSFAYGVTVGMDFNNQHLIQIDPTFQSLGMNYIESPATQNLERDVEMNYLLIPLTYRYVVNGGNNGLNKGTRFLIGGGPYVGILTGANIATRLNGNDVEHYTYLVHRTPGSNQNRNLARLNELIPDGTSPDFKSLYNSIDFGAVVNLGVQSFLTEQLKLTIELRTGISLSDINSEDWKLPNYDGNYEASRNLFAGINVGLAFYF